MTRPDKPDKTPSLNSASKHVILGYDLKSKDIHLNFLKKLKDFPKKTQTIPQSPYNIQQYLQTLFWKFIKYLNS